MRDETARDLLRESPKILHAGVEAEDYDTLPSDGIASSPLRRNITMRTSRVQNSRRRNTTRRRVAWAIGLAVLCAGPVIAADETFTPTAAVTLPGGQLVRSFDISFVDPVIGVYLLADRTNKTVDVIDTTTHTVLTQLTATPPFSGGGTGPNGVITVGHREVWAGDGVGLLKVIDLFSQKTTHVINTGGTGRADELCLDPRDSLVLLANDADAPPFVSFISTKTHAIVKQIRMDGTVALGGTVASPIATNGIEQCQWDRRTGKFYLNLPEVGGPGNDTAPGAVVTFSPKTLQIEQIYSIPISQCAGPQGMAVGPDHQILLGCNDPNKTVPSTVVIDDRNGHILATVAGEDGADQVDFNDADGQYFLSLYTGANPHRLGVIDADEHIAADPSASTGTAGAAHSVAADPVGDQIYVPIGAGAGTVCSSAGGTDALGCIAIYTTPHDDHPDRDDFDRDDHHDRDDDGR